MNPLTPNPFLSYASTTTTTTTTTSKPPQELDPNGKDKASDDPSGSAGQSRYSETDFRPKIDERCNPIGCRHTPQFHESLFVPVGVKSGGSFPGFIAQKKKQATDEDPDPQTLSGINHKRQWIVKPGIDHDIFELRDVSKISSIDRRKAIMGAMQECLSALLYLYLSNGQYRVPKTKLAYLPWKNPYAAQHKSYSVLQNFIAKLNKGRPPEKILTHGVHLLSKFVQGYRDLNQALVVVSGQELKFMDYVKQHRIPERIKVDVGSKYVPLYEELPLIGLLEILAVARLMHDIDVLGHGNNVGFVIEETPHGRIAKAVKIDPGLAFYLFHGEGENCINEDIVNMFLKSLGLANTNNLTQEEYPNQLDKILQPLLPIIGKFARKQFLTDLKDIQTDSHCNYIAWNQLTPKQQKTFLQALDHAINILQNHEALHYLLWRDGLLEKTFGTAVKPVDIDLMIGKLEASAQAQLTVYEQAFKTHKIDADAALLNSDPLALLQDGLRRHATNYAYITRLFPSLTAHDHRLHISESYVNLSIMRREEKEKSQESDGDKDKEKTENIALAYQDEREQHYRSLQQTKTPIEIEKLFDDPTHRRQLIIGVPGVGKSTLCQHLFYRCSQPNGLWANRFDLVFWIPLRRLKSSELESTPHNINTFLAQVAHTHSLSGAVQDRMDLQQLEQLIATRTHKTLWILDGYDEVITEASLEGSPIHRLLNHLTGNKEGPTLLITSRPQTHYTIPFDCVLENKPEQAAACIRFLKTNLTLWNVIHVPILLEIVCNIWDQDATTLLAKVNTLPKLYKMMVDHLWLRYTRKTDVPQNIGHLPKQIAKIAAKGFIDNQGALTNQWLKKLCPENLSYSDWCQQLEQTGVLRAIQSDAKYTQHEFIHLSFQEYFASQIYIKALIQGKERAIEFFDHTQYSHAHRLMWLFTFGGLYQHYQDTRDEAPLRRFWQVVFSRMDVQGTNHLDLIMDLLEACGVDRSMDVHEEAFQIVFGILFNEKYNKGLSTRLNLFKACLLAVSGNLNNPTLTESEVRSLWSIFGYADKKICSLMLPSESYLIQALCARLGDERPYVRSDACEALGQLAERGDKAVIEILCVRLGDKDWNVRRSACQALGQLAERGDKDVIEALSARLGDEDLRVRSTACRGLGQLAERGDKGVIKVLRVRLEDKDPDVKRDAYKALSQLAERGDKGVIEVLCARLGDKYWGVRRDAYEALVQLAERGDKAIIEVLCVRLGDESSNVRRSACQALGQLAECGDKAVIELLCARLEDEDWDVRRFACQALDQLAERGDKAVIEALCAQLGDKNGDVRSSVCQALGQLAERGDKSVNEVLCARLGDKSWCVRSSACQSLGQLAERGDKAVIQALCARLGDEDREVRSSACQALDLLAQRRDKAVIQALCARLGDEGWRVRRSAYQALGQLAERGDKGVIQALCARLGDEDSMVRHSTCEALDQLAERGDKAVSQALCARLGDKDWYVRSSACQALGQLAERGDKSVIEALCARLGDENSGVRSSVCKALVKIIVLSQNLQIVKRKVFALLGARLLNIVMHGKGLDLCCGKDKLTIVKDHPEYMGWLKIVKEHTYKEELPISKNFIESLTLKVEENEGWCTIA